MRQPNIVTFGGSPGGSARKKPNGSESLFMILRALALASLALACAPSPSVAERPKQVSCSVLLPAAPIPGNPGFYLSIIKLTVPPGADAHRHVHDAAEYFQVLSGTGHISIDGQAEAALAPGTIITIPAGVEHQQHNDSDSEPLVYTATFVGDHTHDRVTEYVGEPSRPSGCPHSLKH